MSTYSDIGLEIVLGGPGTGKTHYLMQQLLKWDPAGSVIGFFAYTRAAAQEGATRAIRDHKWTGNQIQYFQTIHSFAFRNLRINKRLMITDKHLVNWGRYCNADLSLNEIKLIHNALMKERETPHNFHEQIQLAAVELDRIHNVPFPVSMKMFQKYIVFKAVTGFLDFEDLLRELLAKIDSGNTDDIPVFDYLAVDEAQDLSRTQWRVLRLLVARDRVKQMIIAGDDRQSVYAATDSRFGLFTRFTAKYLSCVTTLKKSFRCGGSAYTYGNLCLNRMTIKSDFDWEPAEHNTRVHWWPQKWAQHPLIQNPVPGTLFLFRKGHPKVFFCILKQLQEAGLFYQLYGSLQKGTLRLQKDFEPTRGILSSDELYLVNAYRAVHKIWEQKPLNIRERRALYYALEEPAFRQEWVRPLLWMNTSILSWDEYHTALNLIPEMAYGRFADLCKPDLLARSTSEYSLKLIKSGKALLTEPEVRVSTIQAAKGFEASRVVLFNSLPSPRILDWAFKIPREVEHRIWHVAVTRAIDELHIIPLAKENERYRFPTPAAYPVD